MVRWRNLAIALSAGIVLLTVSFLFVSENVHAAGIVKSKSNVANNRTATPIGESRSGPWDVIPLCSSCAYPGMPEEGCLILMDSQTGEIWAYCDEAVVGKAKPKYLGKLIAVGKEIVPPPQPK